ncbi:MAG: hypothetical protein GY696_31110 [Gammaproteobacteria bacterium]|nr:hypothetical protein [Gammaproteobacteria bacterium]
MPGFSELIFGVVATRIVPASPGSPSSWPVLWPSVPLAYLQSAVGPADGAVLAARLGVA